MNAARGGDTLAGRLTRTLILWVGGVWLLCVLGVVWYVDREINANFDNELVEVSHRVFDSAVREFETLDAAAGSDVARPLIAPPQLFPGEPLFHQLLNADGAALLRASEAPAAAFDVPVAPGFANARAWRVHTTRHPSRALYFQVADPLQERRETLNRTLLGLIVPLVAVLPLLAFLLRNIARRELRVLRELESEIALRSGIDLRPIDLPGLPRELRSVGDHVNHLLERLAHALDVERALAANAAHELRTPLAAVRLRLATAIDNELRRDDVQAAIDALEILSHRTEKLLQLSRAESGASLTRAPVDLLRLAGTVAQDYWQDAEVRQRLDLQVPDTAPPQVAGDFDALAIALRNLVENALKYSGGGRVEMEVTADGALAVRDFGPGVDAGRLRTLRERHVRHSDERSGYGLGMSIVATIVHKHGGQLLLASPPAGATAGFEARILLG